MAEFLPSGDGQECAPAFLKPRGGLLSAPALCSETLMPRYLLSL